MGLEAGLGSSPAGVKGSLANLSQTSSANPSTLIFSIIKGNCEYK